MQQPNPTYSPRPRRTEDLISYLVHEYDNTDNTKPLTLEKLVKLVYLTDYRFFTETNRTITGSRWTKYASGPVAEDVTDAVKTIVSHDRIHKYSPTPTTGPFYRGLFNNESFSTLAEDHKSLADEIITEFATEDFNTIMNEVYNIPRVDAANKYEPVL